MPRIGRFPPFGKRFFRRARKLVGSCHFAHFWRAVVALAAMQGRRSLRKLEAACRNHRTRQSVVDAQDILREDATEVVRGYRTLPLPRADRPPPADPPGRQCPRCKSRTGENETARPPKRAATAKRAPQQTVGRQHQQHGKRLPQPPSRKETQANTPARHVIAFSV